MCHAAKSSVLGVWAIIARVVICIVHRVEFASEVFYVRFAKRSENFQKFFATCAAVAVEHDGAVARPKPVEKNEQWPSCRGRQGRVCAYGQILSGKSLGQFGPK
jgi:hypothetical protein